MVTINQFNETQTHASNLEFVERLAYYEKEFQDIETKFVDSPKGDVDCKVASMDYLQVLDRLAYLKINRYVESEFIQYFAYNFNGGTIILKWLESYETRPGATLDPAYPNFKIMMGEFENMEYWQLPFGDNCHLIISP